MIFTWPAYQENKLKMWIDLCLSNKFIKLSWYKKYFNNYQTDPQYDIIFRIWCFASLLSEMWSFFYNFDIACAIRIVQMMFHNWFLIICDMYE